MEKNLELSEVNKSEVIIEGQAADAKLKKYVFLGSSFPNYSLNNDKPIKSKLRAIFGRTKTGGVQNDN